MESFVVDVVPVPTAKRRRSTGFSPDPGGDKRLKISSYSLPYSAHEKTSNVVDYNNPFAISDVLDSLESGKFGSVTKDIEDLIAQKMQILGPYFVKYPILVDQWVEAVKKHHEETPKLENQLVTVPMHQNVIDLEEKHTRKDVPAMRDQIVIIDSDDEDCGAEKSMIPFQEVVLPKLVAPSPALKITGYLPVIPYPGERDLISETSMEDRPNSTQNNKGFYVGVQEEEEDEFDTEDDGLGDIWKEMSMAIECSKDVSVDPHSDEEEEEDDDDDDDCDHSFVLKDDLGYVCRVCGVIGRGIETIFEFQYKVKRSTRTYASDSWNTKKTDVFGVNVVKDDLIVTEIPAHPRHMKQMKPHQVEGFNFLVRNLAGDNPGGCILAHAPGSGKTFMIISFMQSFLGKYPNARPLVVLPKGILSTWKKEFQIWQVEDIPLYDFYTVKADSRSQQLEVLNQWVKKKSILFLGYKQFSSIVCDNGNDTSLSCQNILLKIPSILILDEGHNPRNENTDMVQSLAKVETPRKVVLSGTLYQNHVKEVFNILDLVRPKFLKMETSKPIVRRIQSRVHVPGIKGFSNLVENTLQKDTDFKTKIAVIQDLREMTSKVLHYYKGDFLDELPGLVDFTVMLTLSPRQKSEVAKIKKQSKRKFKISSVGSAVYLHPRLKPLAENCGENSISDHVVDDLVDKLDIRDGVKSKFYYNMLNLCESAGEKLLVFSQYLLPLKYLERLTINWKGWSLGREIFVISGESSSEHREWSMEKFNNSREAKVFFGSIKACGEGISLVGASRIIILDVHLNPSVTRQAIGRAFRPGQKKKVFVYRLVSADSPEEEDHHVCFKKELISKMWFEWNEYCGDRAFEVEAVEVKECGDEFLESPLLGENVKALYRR